MRQRNRRSPHAGETKKRNARAGAARASHAAARTKAVDARSAREAARDATTRKRLLELAGEAFAEHGFRRTTIRDVCRRARTNVASISYHFGSKKKLFLAALDEALARVKGTFPPRPDPPLDRSDLPRFLRFFVKNAVTRILEPRPSWHQKLIQRELVEPTFALDTIVKEQMRPHFTYLRDAIASVAPGASQREVDLCALSIIGQVVYYRCAGPIALRLLGVKELDGALLEEIAEHVASFSARALGARA